MSEFECFVRERGRLGQQQHPSYWDIVRQDIGVDPSNLPASEAWKRLIISFHEVPNDVYMMVKSWERDEKGRFRHTCWDYFLIHSSVQCDVEMAKEFKKQMDTIPLSGCIMDDIEIGENKLSNIENILKGTNKIFVLVTPYLPMKDLPKFTYQESLMRKIYDSGWKRKLIPVIPTEQLLQDLFPNSPSSSINSSTNDISSNNLENSINSDLSRLTIANSNTETRPPRCFRHKSEIPFGLLNIREINWDSPAQLCEDVHNGILPEEQGSIRIKRERTEKIHKDFVARSRDNSFKQIRQILLQLQKQFARAADPTDTLDEITMQLNNIDHTVCNVAESVPGSIPKVNVWNCSNVSLGTSINFSLTSPYEADC